MHSLVGIIINYFGNYVSNAEHRVPKPDNQSKSLVEQALEKCDIHAPMVELLVQKDSVNIWDMVLLSFELIAKKGLRTFEFETAIQREWKNLKYIENSIVDNVLPVPEVIRGLFEDPNNTEENPFLSETVNDFEPNDFNLGDISCGLSFKLI